MISGLLFGLQHNSFRASGEFLLVQNKIYHVKKIIYQCLDPSAACAAVICASLCNKTGNGSPDHKEVQQKMTADMLGRYPGTIACSVKITGNYQLKKIYIFERIRFLYKNNMNGVEGTFKGFRCFQKKTGCITTAFKRQDLFFFFFLIISFFVHADVLSRFQ